MYEIFANDKKIILTNIKDNDNSIKYFPLKEMSIDEIMNEIDKKKFSQFIFMTLKAKNYSKISRKNYR